MFFMQAPKTIPAAAAVEAPIAQLSDAERAQLAEQVRRSGACTPQVAGVDVGLDTGVRAWGPGGWAAVRYSWYHKPWC